MDSLVIDATSAVPQLARAGAILSGGRGSVILAGVATLTAGARDIRCAVAAPASAAARCEEEYKVLVENAARALRSSLLGPHLPDRRLLWVVMDGTGDDAVELARLEIRVLQPRDPHLSPQLAHPAHEAFIQKGIPLVKQSGMDVVASDSRPTTRTISHAGVCEPRDRQATEDAFYSSDSGARAAAVHHRHIESFQDTLIWLSPEAVELLRRDLRAAASPA
jgi:hypothetical protein